MTEDKERKIDWQPLRELALKTPYTMEYLSLMARRKQLKTKKIGRLWYSTLTNIREFETDMKERKEKKREQMRNKYFKKAASPAEASAKEGKEPVKVRVSQSSIYDQIQSELEEVLAEIRDKERRLREEYRGKGLDPGSKAGMTTIDVRDDHNVRTEIAEDEKIHSHSIENRKNTGAYLHKEKQETEELSEKLIMDLGKLLNTANQIQDDVSVSRVKTRRNGKGSEGRQHQKTAGRHMGDVVVGERQQSHEEHNDNHSPFLSLNYPTQRNREYLPEFNNERIEYYRSAIPEKEAGSSWFKMILITVAGLLIFVSVAFILFIFYEA